VGNPELFATRRAATDGADILIDRADALAAMRAGKLETHGGLCSRGTISVLMAFRENLAGNFHRNGQNRR
jgi:hypothetical protein